MESYLFIYLIFVIEKCVAEGRRSSLESALKLEVIALKEENVTLREKVTSLETKLENTEKQRKGLVVRIPDIL